MRTWPRWCMVAPDLPGNCLGWYGTNTISVSESTAIRVNEKAFDLVTFSFRRSGIVRPRGCELAEDMAQEVMFTVYRKAEQIRDRGLFRAWLFKIARNTLCRHYGKQAREVDTVDLADVSDRLVAASQKPTGTPASEFLHWMTFLDSREREIMRLRFIEEWEYHEIAAAQEIPIGTVQWKVFNAKKKLAPYLTTRQNVTSKAA